MLLSMLLLGVPELSGPTRDEDEDDDDVEEEEVDSTPLFSLLRSLY